MDLLTAPSRYLATLNPLKLTSSHSFLHYILPATTFLLVVYFAAHAAYNVFFSPLRNVPGPWYAAVSDFWMITHILRLRRCRAIHDLLAQYGPIVRIGPKKVIFFDPQSMKYVYGTGAKLEKSSFYKSLIVNGHDHAMTTLDHHQHSLKKKGYSPHYTQSNLSLFQPEIHGFVTELIDRLEAAAAKGLKAFDTLTLFRHLMIDVNCAHMFGCSVGSLASWHRFVSGEQGPDVLGQAISDFPKRGLLRSALPDWLWRLVSSIPIARWQALCDSDRLVAEFVTSRVADLQKRMVSGKDDIFEKRCTLVARLLQHRYGPSEAMPEIDIISEGIGHLIAGSDTTSTTLSYTLWELSRRPDLVSKLQDELDLFMPDPRHIPDIVVLRKLPFLNALIKEALRVYTSAPSPLERIVTPQFSASSPFHLLGHNLPAGTIVGSQAWTSHRHAGVFSSPDDFNPDRWLFDDQMDESCMTPTSPCFSARSMLDLSISSISSDTSISSIDEELKVPPSPTDSSISISDDQTSIATQMQAHMFPFGSGVRTCGGKNMAQMILRIILASIVRNFDIVAPEGTNEKSMDMKDSFVIFPASMQCKLVFVPRK